MTGSFRWRWLRAWRYTWLIGALAVAGCAAEHRVPPDAPAPWSQPSDPIPADLDLVIRVDLNKIRAALGPELVGRLRHAAEPTGGLDPTERFLTQALERAEVVVAGLRPREASLIDHVLVLQGDFHGLEPRQGAGATAWEPVDDLGGDVRRWDRKGSVGRASPARIYAFGERSLVLATPAEIDSVELSVERGSARSTLVPPAQGVISFAARVLPLALALHERSPKLAEWLTSAERLEGHVDLESDAAHFEAALHTNSPETAINLRLLLAGLSELLGVGQGARADLARRLRLEAVGSDVVCRLSLPRDVLGRWAACPEGTSDCAW